MSTLGTGNNGNYKTTGNIMKWIAEKANKLPDPFTLFCYLALTTLILSLILNKIGISATYLAIPKSGGDAAMKTVVIRNLISAEYFQHIVSNFVKIYIGFAPLGMVVLTCIAIGFAQRVGFFDVMIKSTLSSVPESAITWIFCCVAICSNITSGAGIILTTALGAAIWYSLGRNPLLGAALGYVGSHGGYSANLLISADDVVLAGITKTAADAFNIVAPTHPLINWYAMIVYTLLMATVMTLITRYLMPRYINMDRTDSQGEASANEQMELLRITDEQKKGLRCSLIALLIFIAAVLIMTIPSNGILRSPDGTILPKSPFLSGIMFIIFSFFMVLGLGFGIGSGKLTKARQVPEMMASGIVDLKSYFIVILPAALFIEFFNASNLSTIISINGGNWLEQSGINGIGLAIAFMLFCTFVNLFMVSASSKWLMLAPIFVPMFARIGFSPALTQYIYRLGESVSNSVTPVSTYLPVLLAVMSQYSPKDEEIGYGTVLNYCLPYAVIFQIVMIAMLVVWMVFALPLGPGTPMFL